MTLLIRKTTNEDIQQVLKLMEDYVVGFYNNPWPGDDRILQLVQDLMAEKIGVQFIAEQDGQLIGFATLYYTYSTMRAERTTAMNDLFVIEKYREGEAEKELFKHCQKYTQEQGCAFMSWFTAETNIRAQQLFDTLGAKRGPWVNYSIN